METPFTLYVDFDSTLYDTRRFTPDFFAMIADSADIAPEDVKRRLLEQPR